VPRRYPAEFRRKVLPLVAAGRPVAQVELVAARKRIAELEHELAIHRRAAELLGDVVPPKGATKRSR